MYEYTYSYLYGRVQTAGRARSWYGLLLSIIRLTTNGLLIHNSLHHVLLPVLVLLCGTQFLLQILLALTLDSEVRYMYVLLIVSI